MIMLPKSKIKNVLLLLSYISFLVFSQFLLMSEHVFIQDLKPFPGYVDEHQHFCLYFVKVISCFGTKELL